MNSIYAKYEITSKTKSIEDICKGNPIGCPDTSCDVNTVKMIVGEDGMSDYVERIFSRTNVPSSVYTDFEEYIDFDSIKNLDVIPEEIAKRHAEEINWHNASSLKYLPESYFEEFRQLIEGVNKAVAPNLNEYLESVDKGLSKHDGKSFDFYNIYTRTVFGAEYDLMQNLLKHKRTYFRNPEFEKYAFEEMKTLMLYMPNFRFSRETLTDKATELDTEWIVRYLGVEVLITDAYHKCSDRIVSFPYAAFNDDITRFDAFPSPLKKMFLAKNKLWKTAKRSKLYSYMKMCV